MKRIVECCIARRLSRHPRYATAAESTRNAVMRLHVPTDTNDLVWLKVPNTRLSERAGRQTGERHACARAAPFSELIIPSPFGPCTIINTSSTPATTVFKPLSPASGPAVADSAACSGASLACAACKEPLNARGDSLECFSAPHQRRQQRRRSCGKENCGTRSCCARARPALSQGRDCPSVQRASSGAGRGASCGKRRPAARGDAPPALQAASGLHA